MHLAMRRSTRLPLVMRSPTLLATFGALLGVQDPVRPPPRVSMPPSKACSTVIRVVSIRVTRPDGTPVSDAAIRLWPAADTSAVRASQASPGPGQYILFGVDAEVPPPRQPTRFVIEASAPWADRPVRSVMTVGADAAGCFPVRLSGDAHLVLRPRG